MNLLYCSNGAVLAWHDSEQQVFGSAYGDGIRVIPYDQPMATLPRVGPPPSPFSPLMGDQRPYAQPTETTALLIGYSSQRRWETSTVGITFTAASGPIPLACDRVSQSLIGNLVQFAATLSPTDTIDFTQDGAHYPLQASEVATMFAAMNVQIQQGRTIEAACIADLNSATPTLLTYDDVDARFASLEAKTLRGDAKKKQQAKRS